MNRNCFALSQKPTIKVRRTAAIGDALASTIIADKLAEQGFQVSYQTHTHNHCVLRRHRFISELDVPGGTVNVNLDGCYENHAERRTRHFSDLFMATANDQLRAQGIYLGTPVNCKPKLVVQANERAGTFAHFSQYPHPWIFVCPRSDSWAVRQVPDYIWEEASKNMPGTRFWLGTKDAPPSFVDLRCRHMDNLILWLSVADILISVDTGPLHVGAALGVPIVALGQSSSPNLHLSDQVDFSTIWPAGLDCLNCQKNICPKAEYNPPCQVFSPEAIATAVKRKLHSLYTDEITAVIAVYRPDTHILNRCLEHILPQVQEVVVCRDTAGKFPDGANHDSKIRYIVKDQKDIGYGRKANYAARHSNGKFLLFLNDDLYAGPNMVAKLRAAMTEEVAVTAPLLRFKDGRIQHAGMVRAGDGGVGFGHIDYGRYEPTIRTTQEVECVTGAAILVDRRTFYDVDGFDEEFYLYCEDTDFMMKIRRAGKKIVYVADAEGVHDEHLSTGKTPNIIKIMNESNAKFGKRWAWYFKLNRKNPGLGKF
jgi:GT2 family glycosyltransferase